MVLCFDKITISFLLWTDYKKFSFFVFSTAVAPILFGFLIDQQFSINQIFTLMLGYLVLANALFLFKLKDYKPVKIA
jgi:hypothetical protein